MGQTQGLTDICFPWGSRKVTLDLDRFPSQFCLFLCAGAALSAPASLCATPELVWMSSPGGETLRCFRQKRHFDCGWVAALPSPSPALLRVLGREEFRTLQPRAVPEGAAQMGAEKNNFLRRLNRHGHLWGLALLPGEAGGGCLLCCVKQPKTGSRLPAPFFPRRCCTGSGKRRGRCRAFGGPAKPRRVSPTRPRGAAARLARPRAQVVS